MIARTGPSRLIARAASGRTSSPASIASPRRNSVGRLDEPRSQPRPADVAPRIRRFMLRRARARPSSGARREPCARSDPGSCGSRLDGGASRRPRCVVVVVPAAIRRYDRHAAGHVLQRPLGEPKDYGGRPHVNPNTWRRDGRRLAGDGRDAERVGPGAAVADTGAYRRRRPRRNRRARGLEHPWGWLSCPTAACWSPSVRAGYASSIETVGCPIPSGACRTWRRERQGGLLDWIDRSPLRREPLDLPLLRGAGIRRHRRNRGRARTASARDASRTCT